MLSKAPASKWHHPVFNNVLVHNQTAACHTCPIKAHTERGAHKRASGERARARGCLDRLRCLLPAPPRGVEQSTNPQWTRRHFAALCNTAHVRLGPWLAAAKAANFSARRKLVQERSGQAAAGFPLLRIIRVRFPDPPPHFPDLRSVWTCLYNACLQQYLGMHSNLQS